MKGSVMLPLAPALTLAPTHLRIDLSDKFHQLNWQYAVDVAIKPSNRKTAFDSRSATLPVVAVVAARHQYAAQDAHLLAVQKTVADLTYGLLAIFAQTMASVGHASPSQHWP
jgi:hypothetical protein